MLLLEKMGWFSFAFCEILHKAKELETDRQTDRDSFCKYGTKWLEHPQRSSVCDPAKRFLTSKSRNAKKGSWKWVSGATMMILICDALMQVGFVGWRQVWKTTMHRRHGGDDHHSHAQTAHRVLVFDMEKHYWLATVNQHPAAHHPLDAPYYSVVDEPQLPHLSLCLVSTW